MLYICMTETINAGDECVAFSQQININKDHPPHAFSFCTYVYFIARECNYNVICICYIHYSVILNV